MALEFNSSVLRLLMMRGQIRGLNGLADTVSGTIAFSDERTIWIVLRVLVENSPIFEYEPTSSSLFRTFSVEYNINRKARKEQ